MSSAVLEKGRTCTSVWLGFRKYHGFKEVMSYLRRKATRDTRREEVREMENILAFDAVDMTRGGWR